MTKDLGVELAEFQGLMLGQRVLAYEAIYSVDHAIIRISKLFRFSQVRHQPAFAVNVRITVFEVWAVTLTVLSARLVNPLLPCVAAQQQRDVAVLLSPVWRLF